MEQWRSYVMSYEGVWINKKKLNLNFKIRKSISQINSFNIINCVSKLFVLYRVPLKVWDLA